MANPNVKVTLAQLNSVVGDILGNTVRIRETYFEADERGVDLVVTPELSVAGYPPEDLTNLEDLLAAVDAALAVLAAATLGRRAALIVGAPYECEEGVYNAALAFANGKLLGVFRKRNLPNYGVFDEKRNFVPETRSASCITVAGAKVGVIICEDLWNPLVCGELKADGADLLVCVNASPFRPHVLETRVRDVAGSRISETGLPLVYVNTVGGQDEVVFDGGSFCMDAEGRRTLQAPQWEECAMDCDLSRPFEAVPGAAFPDPMEEIWRAMCMGVADYARKNGFTDVVLGLSGGMDSALVAAVAGDALGAERVHCVRLPSRYTSELSNTTAEEMCGIWGFSMDTVAIGGVVDAATEALGPKGAALKKLTLENMQARARGFLLMTLSNDNNWLLLSTGNKSEIAVGYATLYGDMCGGYNPLKDVLKTTVYALAKWRNGNRPEGLKGPEGVVIPVAIIDRPPSAELAPGQLDSDSLPPYPMLDAILVEMIERRTPLAMIPEKGFEPAMVDRVYSMLKRAEYKRRQGAPGPKTSQLAFARDRRMPIVNRFDTGQEAKLRAML